MNEKDEQAELAALLRRAQDLADRCDRAGVPTSTTFLTPAQRCALAQWAPRHSAVQPVFSGGYPDAERQVAFFLPDWMDEPPIEETLRAVQIKPGFGTPGHRDYLGAILGLGVSRPWLGDVLVTEDGAYVLCLPSVAVTLLDQLTQVGRTGGPSASNSSATRLTAFLRSTPSLGCRTESWSMSPYIPPATMSPQRKKCSALS